MVQTIFAKELSLYDLETEFGLQLTEDACFTEWVSDVTVTESEKQALNRIRSNYLNLTRYRFMSEEAVKMVVLSPLRDLAGFYQPPFAIVTETSIQISAEDDGIIVKGSIDVLVVLVKLIGQDQPLSPSPSPTPGRGEQEIRFPFSPRSGVGVRG